MSPKKKSTHRKKKSGVTTGTAAAAAVTNRDGFPSADDADDGCVSVPGLRHRVPRRLLAAHVPLERVAVERVAVAPAVAVPSKPPSSKSSSASSSDSSSKSPSFGRSLSSSLGGSVGPRSAGGPGTDRRAGTRTGATVVGGAAAAAVVPPPCGPPEGEGLHAVRVRRAPDAALQATVAVPFRYSSYEGALDVDARLIRAFGAFPYPTRERALRLARRAGAAVSGVWAWFEAQRLKHGISWTPEEVLEARLRLRVGAADDDDDDDAGAGEAQPEAPGGSGAGLGAAAATGGVARTTAAGATAAGALSYDCKQKILWESYRRSAYVDATECQRLSQETGLLPEAVRRWFKKKRANSGGAWQQLPRSKRQPWHRNVSGRFIRSEEAGALPANGDQSGPAESSAPALPPPALPPPHAGKQWSWTRETSARTTWQRELLQVNYEANPYPSEETIACLASEVGLKPHQVKKYFSNRRYTVKLARESVGGGDAGGGGGFGGRRSSGAGGGGNAGGGGYSVTVGYADGGGNAGGGGGSFGGRRSSGGNAGGGGYAATVDHAGTVSHSGGGGGHAGTVSHSPTVSHSGGGGGNAGTGDACRARRARRTKKYIGGKKTYEQLAILNRAFDESRSPSPALYASLAQETRLAVCTVRNFFNKKRYKLLHAKSHTRRRYGWWGVARGGGGQVDGELGGSAAVAGGDGDGGDDGDGGGVVARWYEASDQDGVLVMDMGSGGGP